MPTPTPKRPPDLDLAHRLRTSGISLAIVMLMLIGVTNLGASLVGEGFSTPVVITTVIAALGLGWSVQDTLAAHRYIREHQP